MATLPNAKVALRLALAQYLRTNLLSPWPNLVVTENWVTPQKTFPPQAVTVLAPSAGQKTSYHAPVVWSVTVVSGITVQVIYSYGILTIPLQLDAWAQYESIRDDVTATLGPLLNQNVDVTLGLVTTPELTYAPGLVLQLSSNLYYGVTAEYRFEPAPSPVESSNTALMGEWRATWAGTGTVYLMAQENFPSMASAVAQLQFNAENVRTNYQLFP